MATQRNSKAYTAALVGDADSSGVNAVMGLLGRALAANARVVSGDYLDRKNLADRHTTFHIGIYNSDGLVDLMNCPVTLRNLSATLNQADRLVWIIRPDDLNASLKRSILAAIPFDIRSHLVVFNTAGLSPDLKDPELLEVMAAEARDFFESSRLSVEAWLTVDAPSPDPAVESSGVDALASYLLTNWVRPRHAPSGHPGAAILSVEQSYNVSGHSGKPTRAGYGPVRGGSVAVGQMLDLLMVGGSTDQVRVAEIQEFGQSIAEATVGSSAAVLFQSAPKDRPKVGDVLTDQPAHFQFASDFSLDLSLLPDELFAQALGSLNGLDVCIGMACVSCKVLAIQASAQDPTKGTISLRSPVSVPFVAGQATLAGNGAQIIGWGVVERS
ncbi:MAG: hypothetical protein M1570_02270 [Chloroflexi bacterium]|nr:hypothetical protein [Chloroflexota bacterium]